MDRCDANTVHIILLDENVSLQPLVRFYTSLPPDQVHPYPNGEGTTETQIEGA